MKFRHAILNDKQIKSYGGVFMYIFDIETAYPQKIQIRISDEKKANALYYNRYKTIDGKAKLYIRMPQSPSIALIEIFTETNNGYRSQQETFRLTSKQIVALPTKFSAFDIRNPLIKEFIFFAQEFSENSGDLSTRTQTSDTSIYMSNNGSFRIDYADVLKDSNGKALSTPSHIGVKTGIIGVSKKHFNEFTIPGRMAILLHEFSHFFLNKNPKSEEEADLNALLIYLGLGYPRIEAERVFLNTFDGNASNENVGRYKKIKSLIYNFDKADLKLV